MVASNFTPSPDMVFGESNIVAIVVYSVMFKKKPLTDSKKTARLMELLKPTRYKPETVEQLARETKGRIYEK